MIRRDLSLSLIGIGAGQLIMFAATPFLARIYTPAEFGAFSVNYAVAGVIATVAALRLDLALSGARDEEVADFARLSFVLPLVVVPVSTLALWALVHSPVARILPFGWGDVAYIAAIGFLQGLSFVGAAIATRTGRFQLFAAIKILQPLVFAFLALLVLDDLSASMAIGALAAALAILPAIRSLGVAFRGKIALAPLRTAWRFPAISAPMALLDVLALAMPVLVITSAFGEQASGNYAQVQRLIGAPLVLAAMAGGHVFLKHAGDRFRSGVPVMPLYRRFVLVMTGFALAVFLVLVLAGEEIVGFLVGPNWRTDTPFLLLVVLPVLWRVVASPVSHAMVLTNRIGAQGIWQALYFIGTAAMLIVGASLVPLDTLLAVFAVSEFVFYGAYLGLSAYAANRADTSRNGATEGRAKCAG